MLQFGNDDLVLSLHCAESCVGKSKILKEGATPQMKPSEEASGNEHWWVKLQGAVYAIVNLSHWFNPSSSGNC